MSPSLASRSGVSPEHPPRPHPLSSRLPTFDDGVQFDVIRDSLVASEQIYGVYASESAGIAMAGVTNKRVLLLDTAFAGGRAALITAPYSRITTVSFVSGDGEPLFSRTIAVQVGRIFYEITCRGEEQAAEMHDLITWHLLA